MLDALLHFDQQLLLALNGSDSVFWDGFWMTITKTGTWVVYFLSLFVVLMRNTNIRQLALIVCIIVLAIVLADQGASSVFKPMFHRLRPSHDPVLADLVHVVNDYRGGTYGFISSHAANTFALFTLISLIMRYGWVTFTMFLYAMFTSYSRIYLGVHYPGDILCGAIWGVLCGALSYALYMYIFSRMSDQQKFYSSTYTQSGILKDDTHLIPLVFYGTLIGALFVALIYSLNN